MQYNGNHDVKVVRRYYSGTGTLRKGQVLATDMTASASDPDPKLRLGNSVADLAAGNVGVMAGVVLDTEAGKVGPCFVELLVPQSFDVIPAEVDGATAVAALDLLEPDVTKNSFIKATAAAGDNLFKALQAQATSAKVVILVQKV